MRQTDYQRLTRSKNRSTFSAFSAQRSSLWLGQDHLLCVDSSGYTETYKRFYFRDIQSVHVRQTDSWKYFGLANGMATLLFTAIVIGNQDRITALIFGPVALLFLVFFVFNLLWGPTCATHLHTAVQSERLPALNRWKKTNRVLERIRPLIVAAQGEMAAEEIPARLQAQQLGAPLSPGSGQVVVDDPNAPPRIVS